MYFAGENVAAARVLPIDKNESETLDALIPPVLTS